MLSVWSDGRGRFSRDTGSCKTGLRTRGPAPPLRGHNNLGKDGIRAPGSVRPTISYQRPRTLCLGTRLVAHAENPQGAGGIYRLRGGGQKGGAGGASSLVQGEQQK